MEAHYPNQKVEDEVINRRTVGLGLAALAVALVPQKVEAQRVSADIHIGGWPVAGTIRIGDRGHGYYPRPRRRAVYVAYPAQLRVERRHGWNWKKHRDARLVVVYYDRQCGLYFDRYHHGLEEIRVLYDRDRYYWYDDYDGRDDDRFLYDRRGHGRDRYDDDRYRDDDRRDRRDDRRDRRDRDDDDDGRRWEHDH